MTTEYTPGSENILVTVDDSQGLVRIEVWDEKTQVRLYGFLLPPEVARTLAQKITFRSWSIEDRP